MQAVPYYRSAAIVSFPITHPRGALLSVRLENGAPLPAGAIVRLGSSHDNDFPSGMNGEVYVTGLADQNELRAEWTGGSCHFTMAYTTTADPLPRMGPYICRSVEP